MAGSHTNYAEAHILDAVYGGQPLGAPGTWYLALLTASPTEAGLLANEAPNYARLAVTNNLANLPAAVQGAPTSKTNGVDFAFAAATGAGTGLVTHVALMDSAGLGTGNMWAYSDLATPKSYGAGDVPLFPAGTLQFTAD